MLQVYTGNGKGKTTAALGVLLRAVATGMKIAVVAFDKGGDNYSERKIITKRFPEVDFFATGLDRIDPETKRFRFGVTAEDRREGERGLDIVRDLFSNARYNLIILDEINSSTSLGIIEEQRVLELLEKAPPNIELILTGRNAPKSFIDKSDLATEMNLVKHYFYHGTKAREGIDY